MSEMSRSGWLMRLEYLWLRDFKNLVNFEVHIDPSHPVDVLVGRNGTGKSNLLEALILIFRDLDLHSERPSLCYTLRYSLGQRSIEIDADPDRPRGRLRVRADGNPTTLKAFRAAKSELLPRFVFGYYSGQSHRFESHFDAHRTDYYRRLLSDEEGLPFRSLFLAEPFHSQFVLLAFLLEPDEAVSGFLRTHLRIISLASVQFIVREPDWASRTDDRFWGARGAPRELLERIFVESVAPSREKATERSKTGRSSSREHLHLFLDGEESIGRVYDHYSSRQDFFKALESLDISDLLYELKVVVRVAGAGGAVEFKELSEGEQQLLIVLGLLRFTQTRDSLLLLDEPDTHLNPAWSVRYTQLLTEMMGDLQTSQVLMATHDPLVVASLVKEQVVLLERTGDGDIAASNPDRDPRGMGVAGLLTSEIYGLRSQLDLVTQHLLDEKRELASRRDRTPDEDVRLQELAGLVDEVDLAATARDPLYREFVEAMSVRMAGTGADDVVLSRFEIDEREQIAREVVAELVEEGEPK